MTAGDARRVVLGVPNADKIDADHTLMRTVCAVAAVLLASVRITQAFADEAKPSLTYSRWMKFCGAGTCSVSESSSSISSVWCLPRVRAVLTTRRGEAVQTLQITIAGDVDKSRGLRLRIDRRAVIERPYAVCADNGCMAEISGPDLVDRLKQGHTLIAEVAEAAGSTLMFSLPLDGFAPAYDGPPLAELKVFKAQPGKLQKALQEQKQPPAPPRRIEQCGPK